MSIRFSTLQINRQGLNGLLDVQAAATKTQQQISTGKRILTAGDDPVAATRVLQLTQELNLNALYNNNAAALQNKLEREDVAMSAISELLQRTQEIALQAGNGALEKEQRGFLAIELDGIIESMVQSMNARDGNGNYIFSGHSGSEKPFSKGDDGFYNYTGDEGQRTIQLGPNSFVKANDSGKYLFEDIPSAAASLAAEANPNNRAIPPAQIGSVQIIDQTAFDEFYPEDVVVEFRPLDEVEPPSLNYHIRQVSDGRLLGENRVFQIGEKVEFAGASLRISGTPLPGDSFIVNSTQKKGLLSTLEDFSLQLKSIDDSSEGREKLTNEIATALSNLESAQTRLLEGQSSVGARLNLVENVRSSNADIKLATQASLSEIQDLDFASAVSQLSQETFILEAAQASFARVSGLTLFNFL